MRSRGPRAGVAATWTHGRCRTGAESRRPTRGPHARGLGIPDAGGILLRINARHNAATTGPWRQKTSRQYCSGYHMRQPHQRAALRRTGRRSASAPSRRIGSTSGRGPPWPPWARIRAAWSVSGGRRVGWRRESRARTPGPARRMSTAWSWCLRPPWPYAWRGRVVLRRRASTAWSRCLRPPWRWAWAWTPGPAPRVWPSRPRLRPLPAAPSCGAAARSPGARWAPWST